MSKAKKIINSYMLHSYSEPVQGEFADWLSSPCDKEAKDALLQSQWDGIDAEASKLHLRRSYEVVWERIRRSEAKTRRVAVLGAILRVAAIVVIAVALVASVKLYVASDRSVEWNEVYVANGSSRTVTLDDGSTIRLTSGSRLIYPSSFDKDVRRVYLSGEAYADIAKDEMRRFVISTEQIDVVVHGTRFNVRSYDANSEVELMLFDGAIDMQTKNLRQNRVVAMRPGDFIKLDKRSGRITCENIPQQMLNDTPDVHNLTFINSRLGDISMQLERLFDVRIVIDQAALAEERYYSAFVNNESLDRILKTFEQNGKLSYYWERGEIHLHRK